VDNFDRRWARHARYNRSKSGWFDSMTFEDWFELSFLEGVKYENAQTVLIGDNFSSHIMLEFLNSANKILSWCVYLQIQLISHITHPLNVSFFGPMKKIWRSI